MFDWLKREGGIETAEMLKTFNSGIGMVVVVEAGRAEAIEALLAQAGETVHRLGRVTAGQGVAYTGDLK